MNFIGFIIVALITNTFISFAFLQLIGALFVLLPNKDKLGFVTIIIWSCLSALFYYLMNIFAADYIGLIVFISILQIILSLSKINSLKKEYLNNKEV